VLAEIPAGAWAFGTILITALVAPSWLAWWNSRFTKNEMRNNGGGSFRDAIDQLAADQKAHSSLVLARLDAGARMLGNHSDRLAVLESRPCPHDPNNPTNYP